MKKFALIAVLVVAACSSAPIEMRHPTTGATAQCGPFPEVSVAQQLVASEREAQCIHDFQRQGYERVSK